MIGTKMVQSMLPYVRMDASYETVPGCGHSDSLSLKYPRTLEYGGDKVPPQFGRVHTMGEDGSASQAPWCAYLSVPDSLWNMFTTTNLAEDDEGKLLTAEQLFQSDEVMELLFGKRSTRNDNQLKKLRAGYDAYLELVEKREA